MGERESKREGVEWNERKVIEGEEKVRERRERNRQREREILENKK